MKVVFWVSLFLLLYTHLLYPAVLYLMALYIRRRPLVNNNDYDAKISIVIAIHNEENVISKKLQNILDSISHPSLGKNVEIILASDGSSDNTVAIANKFKQYMNLKILSLSRQGKALAHNEAIKNANGELIIFTDADAEFDTAFIKNVANYFSLKDVGCVTGNLIYKPTNSAISKSESLYWKIERKIRSLESNIGILATASGACMAVRKELWLDLTPTDDSDFITPLDVVLQGYRVIFAPDAIAYDIPPSSVKGEFKTRIRQTSKNFIGTLRRWGWVGLAKHPFVSWGLVSHKILRWLTPFFMFLVLLGDLLLLREGFLYRLIFVKQIIFYCTAIVGFFGEVVKIRLPVASAVFSFCVASFGMGVGVIKSIVGKAPSLYGLED
ncbi:MAG: glycosyltransferase [Firmicutes bacterium]|nr:glycosyltransferase [Bacillota bacterium]